MNNMRGNQEDSISSHMQRRGIRPSYSVDSMPGMPPQEGPAGPPSGGGFMSPGGAITGHPLAGGGPIDPAILEQLRAAMQAYQGQGGQGGGPAWDEIFQGGMGGPQSPDRKAARQQRRSDRQTRRQGPPAQTRQNEMGGGRRQVSDLPVVEDSMTRGPEGMGSEEVGPSTPKPSGMKPPQGSSTTPPKFRNFRGDASDIAAGKAAGGFGAFDMDPKRAKMLEYLKQLGMK